MPAQEWISRALRGTQKDEVCATFDDGLAESLLALPSLTRRGLTAAWNVYTGPLVGVPNRLETYRAIRNAHGVDAFYEAFFRKVPRPRVPATYLADRKYLTEDDIAFRYWRNELATPQGYEEVMDTFPAPATRWPWLRVSELRALRDKGHVIGFHTHSHPTVMRGLSREQQELEYATSLRLLQMVTGEKPTTMSHPCGEVTGWGLRYLRKLGVKLAWGATMAGTLPMQAPRWSTGYWR